MGLGDLVAVALGKVGITKERVAKFLGHPCGCDERQEKLNRLGALAKRIITGKVDDAAMWFTKLEEDER